jgi:hypothetical protein
MGAINTSRSNIKSTGARTTGGAGYEFDAQVVMTEEKDRTTAQVLITFTFNGRTYTHRIDAS